MKKCIFSISEIRYIPTYLMGMTLKSKLTIKAKSSLLFDIGKMLRPKTKNWTQLGSPMK